KALARFDEKNRTRRQGSAHDGRLMRQTAILPSRRRSVMPRVRYVIAASLVALMAGSATWVYVTENPRAPVGPTVAGAPTTVAAREPVARPAAGAPVAPAAPAVPAPQMADQAAAPASQPGRRIEEAYAPLAKPQPAPPPAAALANRDVASRGPGSR